MILTYPTALHYWLQADSSPSHYYSFEEIPRGAYYAASETMSFPLPVHAIVPGASRRLVRENIKFHCAPANLPPDSFVKINQSLYVVRPELCFLLAAREKKVPALVLLANNLCSTYKLNAKANFGQSPREPVTTTKRIADYLTHIKSAHGIRAALRAIRYASDRSNSPMESILAALARLPFALGGFALPEFYLNRDIFLSKAAAAFFGKTTCCCDLVWEKKKLVIEYDSTLVHEETKQSHKDKKRATALTMSGYTVINITWEQIDNTQKVETVFLELRRCLGLTTHNDRFQKFSDIRWNTIHSLLYSFKN